ncbi:hypothetical protein A3715_01400 [Oleiphilus sp. HI0009]|nr:MULTISPECIES: 3-oxoacyl-ACP reductase [unclassified Oleiphilus]KZX78809.1 hypothetical protein A3715_01400 [Oleiphilus sp. HI0009]MCH2157767.1 3-oxoacyl-ACP reductase [Oleiphilaceae bacterium]KZY63396.1 hypothetical protein A3738_11895 [Oleiphilus sp. HI0066]KZY69288.1 hypothetical protein A3739_09045 [Oleiphilus sp. HI0067]KZZ58588.1 hypothetical protein A3762_07495 [Oleiphilus sp. HI0125]
MHDFYTRIAQSSFGKTIFDSVGLPSPPILKRSPDNSMEQPRGRILIGGGIRAKATRKLINELQADQIKLASPYWDDPKKAALFNKHNSAKQKLELINFAQTSNHKFKGIIFDATGFETASDLKSLYVYFHHALKHLKQNGRVIVITNRTSDEKSPENNACIEGTRSFVRSLAKEIGAKGASANLIEVESGADKNCYPALAFLLSRKSSYITGQSLTVSNTRTVAPSWHKPLKGKIALVTGAAFGIGAETARVLARDGAIVVCLDIPINQAPLTQFASSIGGHAIALDLTTTDAVEELLGSITSQLGVIDIVVHNAGITRDKTLRNMRPEQWDSVLNLNLEKIIKINEALIEKKALAKNARIVGVSSISGIAGNFGQTNYACSKGGLAGYTQAMASSLSNGMTINAVAPGFIETRMTSKVPFVPREVGRRSNAFSQGGLPIDVAEVIAFMCQSASQAINGNVVRVCGQSLLGR